MRRGERVNEPEIGGSWECSAIALAEESPAIDTTTGCTVSKTTGAKSETPALVGCPRTARLVGIVLQQSSL